LNQKGGVGKTTLVCHLAYAAVRQGLRVLVVDFDSQRNATLTLAGILEGSDDTPADQIFTAERPEEVRTLPTESGVHLLSGTLELDWIDAQLSIDDVRNRTDFVRALGFDRVIFDTPPALGLRHLAPLLWAHAAFVPVEPDAYSTSGLAQCLETLHFARTQNHGLTYQLIVNRMKLSSATHRAITGQLCETAPFRQPILTDRIAVAIAQASRRPVWELPNTDRALKETWLTLCQELVA
jgi:chromosome partitioning protein